MKITDIISMSAKPVIYEKGNSFMWTDEHISKQLLDIHLNPDIDLGSRKMSTISKTVNWILNSQTDNRKLKILDLGCGPGLYTKILAEKGHEVTGVDISKSSIDYAKTSAHKKGLDINYIQASYLNISLEEEKFDLVLLIYTDFGVLTPVEREYLLKMVFRVLKKGGTLIFDVLKNSRLEQRLAPKSWEAVNYGFWKDSPYLALSESFLYKEEKVILFQHLILDSNENMETYRFWTHFFNPEDITQLLNDQGYGNITLRENILPAGDIWNGDNVIFCSAVK